MFSGIIQRFYQLFGAAEDTSVNLVASQEVALRRCSVKLRQKLDLVEIIPHLKQRNLLTEIDVYNLKCKSPQEGADHLVSILPTKKDGWWDELMASLKLTTTGTGHDDLVNLLETEFQKLTSGNASADSTTTADDADKQVTVHRSSVVHGGIHEALNDALSGITRAMCALGENPFIFRSKLTVEDRTDEPAKLKNELEELKHKYKVMVNQVKLIELHELLIEKSEKFSTALSEVLQLYVEHFKSKKISNSSLLSQNELEMITIIETVTECTENINMDKERESWSQCLAKMCQRLVDLKKTLYSSDTDEMVKLQETWSLRGDAEKKAQEWIEERRKVIEAGKNCLIKLNEICEDSNVSDITKMVCRAVENRIDVGESCLKAWASWIDHRTNLSK